MTDPWIAVISASGTKDKADSLATWNKFSLLNDTNGIKAYNRSIILSSLMILYILTALDKNLP